MSKPNDIISTALNAITKHRDFIHEVYSAGGYTKNGSADDRNAYELQQHRIFSFDDRDRYRISNAFKRFLDDVTHREKLYESLGDAAGPQVLRIAQLQNSYAEAVISGHQSDADRISDDFTDACDDLADTFNTGIARLLNQSETNFGLVKSVEEKSRQNSHYLSQTKRFSDALGALGQYGIELGFADGRRTDMSLLEQPYRQKIGDRKTEWHTALARLLHFFETYLFKLRSIAPDVKRFRQFASFLQQNPGYELPELEDSSSQPQWVMRAASFTTVAYSDVNAPSDDDYLSGIARQLPATKAVVSKERERGYINRSVNQTEEMSPIPPHIAAIYAFAESAVASLKPLSARDWKRENCPELGIPDDLWLLSVARLKHNPKGEFNHLIFQNVEWKGDSAISRNLFVEDVHVHGR